MYSLFFHLSGLALIEIIFYFNYIGPMETYVFKNAIEHAASFDSVDDEGTNTPIIYVINPFNSTQTFAFDTNIDSDYSLNLQNNADQAANERNRHNKELYDLSLIYWGYLAGFSIIILCSEFSFRYALFIRDIETNQETNDENEDTSGSIQMTNIEQVPLRNRNRLDSLDEVEVEDTSHLNPIDTIPHVDSNDYGEVQKSFIEWDEVRKTLVKATAYNSMLATLILTFEYLFFTHIILQYKIISLDEITYVLYKILNSLIYHFIQNEMKIIVQ